MWLEHPVVSCGERAAAATRPGTDATQPRGRRSDVTRAITDACLSRENTANARVSKCDNKVIGKRKDFFFFFFYGFGEEIVEELRNSRLVTTPPAAHALALHHCHFHGDIYG